MLTVLLAILRALGLAPRAHGLSVLDPQKLRIDQLKLEQAGRKLLDEITDLEEQKDSFFRLGSTDVTERERLILARKILRTEKLIAGKDASHGLISSKLSALESLAQLRENEALVTKLGLCDGILGDLDVDEIREYVDQTKINVKLFVEKTDELRSACDDARPVVSEDHKANAEVHQLAELMRVSHQANSHPNSLEMPTSPKRDANGTDSQWASNA